MRVAIFATLVALLATGCSSLLPNAARVEIEHVSHPMAGPPFGPRNEEDALSQLNILVRWQQSAWYAESGLGYKLEDSGMYGPRLTFTARVGREIRFDR